jgi:hypothetical protein
VVWSFVYFAFGRIVELTMLASGGESRSVPVAVLRLGD